MCEDIISRVSNIAYTLVKCATNSTSHMEEVEPKQYSKDKHRGWHTLQSPVQKCIVVPIKQTTMLKIITLFFPRFILRSLSLAYARNASSYCCNSIGESTMSTMFSTYNRYEIHVPAKDAPLQPLQLV